uniref:Protein disabled n=1 Tax=Megaselia scalaris TaxID=36166 RepID=T1GH05_MEGSC
MNNGSVTALTSSKINNTDGAKAKTSPESVADLVDLEQELNCLQRGINQMERITPNEPTPIPTKSFTEDDPFGDSFTNVVPSAYSILPPPESSSTRSSRHSKPVKPPETIPTLSNLLTSAPINNSTSSDNWLAELSQPDVFDTSAATNALHNTSLAIGITNSTSLGTTSLTYSATSSPKQTTSGGGFDEFNIENATQLSQASKDDDDLQDLDPLGTGKSKPYVDKKYFFHEIKNPPKKVLKELTTNSSGATTSDTALQPESLVDMLEGNGISTPKAPLASSDSYESNQSNEVQPPQQASNTSTLQQQQSTATSGSYNTTITNNKSPSLSRKPLNLFISTNINSNINKQPSYIDNTEDSSGLNSVMMARDTDPFSPTRKKSDPFQDGNDIFGKMDSTFQFEFEKAKEAAEEGLNEESSKPTHSTPVVPSADRYAVFREIIDLELQNCPNDPTSSDEGYPPQIGESQIEEEEQKIPKIDTKITEAISNAKDRYAALRDIILVEDLFEKPSTISHQVELEDDRDDSMHEKSLETGTGTAADDESSPEEAQDIMDEESGAITSIQTTMKDKFLTVTDDVEIDELMNRAISNLSLDSRDHLSPSNVAKSPQTISPNAVNQKTKSPINLTTIQVHTSQFSDVSTSPIPLQKLGGTVDEKIIPKSKSPIQSNIITSLRESTTPNKLTDGSLSDIVCNSSPDMEQQKQVIEDENESWAYGPKDWKSNKRWPKGQTSSSSRDLSPWDDEGNEYKKRIPPNDRHGYYMRNSKRLNSCDDDYDYEEEMAMRRERKMKGMSRSRDNFDFDPPGWYSGSGHHSWSPQDYEEARARQFERGGYDRSTYGPPFYDKRDLKMPSHAFYDRRGYDKRKFYRDREYSGRTPTSNYDFESYSESYDKMSTKGRRDYENVYDEDFRGYGKSRPDYFYEGKSFDRESNESFESAGRRRRSFGSGDVYGSLESREDFRDRYTGEKARSLRKGMKFRSGASCEFEQDSENEVHI